MSQARVAKQCHDKVFLWLNGRVLCQGDHDVLAGLSVSKSNGTAWQCRIRDAISVEIEVIRCNRTSDSCSDCPVNGCDTAGQSKTSHRECVSRIVPNDIAFELTVALRRCTDNYINVIVIDRDGRAVGDINVG